MLIKNKKYFIIIFLFILICFSLKANADEFDITAKEIIIDKENQTLIGKGSVEALDSDGKIIFADKITYKKSEEFLLAEGKVKISDNEGNVLKTDKATYDKLKGSIFTYENTKIILKEGYQLAGRNILYNTFKKTLQSEDNSFFSDEEGNNIETNMFQYNIAKKLFSSVGKIKVIDINKNKYFFKEIYIDTEKKEMIGSDISVILDQENFGVSEESEPRFVANDIFVSEDRTKMSKGVFTVCKKREGKCPTWSLKAKNIVHDKAKKTIYYKNATLKIFDIPIFYFPKFFHPDPTVKRQSGFLIPSFSNSASLGTGFTTPYYWAMSDDKDMTFTPKYYFDENILFLNEYRQAFKNGFLTLDTSFTEGYQNTSAIKTTGSRSHIFTDLDLNLNKDDSYESKLSFKTQRTSNDTYFRKHDINTTLVNPENTTLQNEIKYSFSNDDTYFDITTNVYQDLRKKQNSDQYEFIVPNIMYGKTFFTEKFGVVNLKSNALYSKYSTNKQKTFLTNDIIWSPPSKVTKNGFVNTLEGMLRNTNYETSKTNTYKDGDMVNELNAVLARKTSLPLRKDGINYSNLFSPNFMIRYAPGHMRDISDSNSSLNYANLYDLNKTSEIEQGLSAVLGFDFNVNKKDKDDNLNEKFKLSMGQVYNFEHNDDIPAQSSLDQKMSDVVGEMKYNFSEIGNIDYKFSVDHNFQNVNYNEISTELNIGMIKFNLGYLEQQKHVGTEHYASAGISLDINKNNNLSFSTKQNYKTDSTEYHNISYQYTVDCLKAGLVYRREFYQDSDLDPSDNLMFTVTFVPFGTVNTATYTRE